MTSFSGNACSMGLAQVKRVALSCLQASVMNLCNIRVKVNCGDRPFKSSKELPSHTVADREGVTRCLQERLASIFGEEDQARQELYELGEAIMSETTVQGVLTTLSRLYTLCWRLVSQWGVSNNDILGIIPLPPSSSPSAGPSVEVDLLANRLHLHWSHQSSGGPDFLSAMQSMLESIREQGRQPSETEFFLTHLAYQHVLNGGWDSRSQGLPLGTPGFRPYTQTYMSLTDPGDGHVLGTTRFSDWMKGAIVHVEHLERPRHLPRKNIESYRVPSIIDFARVRLHVGTSAPTTYFVGRTVKDSGNFDHDFLKVVHLTAAAASAAFFLGAAECKVAMEMLTTSQAVRYMRALRAQIQRSKGQFLSAAWNLNQTLLDDFDCTETSSLNERFDIAVRAIEITSLGGFDKVTWDGASDTYPSKCIMYQLNQREAVTLVHEAHERGLVTYFSAGFKFKEIQYAVKAGVDGVGIGGAQVLRYMDADTGMHGPYMEENIPRILASRDEAAESVQGRGVQLLARLDSMYFEGSLSRPQNELRQQLFQALLGENESEITALISRLNGVCSLSSEGSQPFLHRAKRLVEAQDPMLKEFAQGEQWRELERVLRGLIASRDEEGVMEEYDSDHWLSLRERYRHALWPEREGAGKAYSRRASFAIPTKA